MPNHLDLGEGEREAGAYTHAVYARQRPAQFWAIRPHWRDYEPEPGMPIVCKVIAYAVGPQDPRLYYVPKFGWFLREGLSLFPTQGEALAAVYGRILGALGVLAHKRDQILAEMREAEGLEAPRVPEDLPPMPKPLADLAGTGFDGAALAAAIGNVSTILDERKPGAGDAFAWAAKQIIGEDPILAEPNGVPAPDPSGSPEPEPPVRRPGRPRKGS